jgi:Holliday junction resolvasome RuvABC ATP-dependent DNA helicase subunit
VLRLAERTIGLAAGQGGTSLSLEVAETMLRQQGFDGDGLKPLERRTLELLREQGGPVSLGRLQDLLQLDRGTLLHEIEPELIARRLIQVTERGRVALPPGRGPRTRPPGNQASAVRRTFANTPWTASIHEYIRSSEA